MEPFPCDRAVTASHLEDLIYGRMCLSPPGLLEESVTKPQEPSHLPPSASHDVLTVVIIFLLKCTNY